MKNELNLITKLNKIGTSLSKIQVDNNEIRNDPKSPKCKIIEKKTFQFSK